MEPVAPLDRFLDRGYRPFSRSGSAHEDHPILQQTRVTKERILYESGLLYDYEDIRIRSTIIIINLGIWLQCQ